MVTSKTRHYPWSQVDFHLLLERPLQRYRLLRWQELVLLIWGQVAEKRRDRAQKLHSWQTYLQQWPEKRAQVMQALGISSVPALQHPPSQQRRAQKGDRRKKTTKHQKTPPQHNIWLRGKKEESRQLNYVSSLPMTTSIPDQVWQWEWGFYTYLELILVHLPTKYKVKQHYNLPINVRCDTTIMFPTQKTSV